MKPKPRSALVRDVRFLARMSFMRENRIRAERLDKTNKKKIHGIQFFYHHPAYWQKYIRLIRSPFRRLRCLALCFVCERFAFLGAFKADSVALRRFLRSRGRCEGAHPGWGQRLLEGRRQLNPSAFRRLGWQQER